MAGGVVTKSSSNPTRSRKRVEASSSATDAVDIDVDADSTSSLKRAKNGSAFTRCEECNKDVAVALIGFHNCSLDAKIKMSLESKNVDIVPEVKKKPASRNKSKSIETKSKKAKDPNAPKRPKSSYFLFMDDFRKSFKETNPDCKSVATVAKECGEKWKSMTDEEKKCYVDAAIELKAKYVKDLESYKGAENQQDEEDDSPEKEEKETDTIEVNDDE